MRGNLPTATGTNLDNRSIPACAGEPAPVSAPSQEPQVYPRVCGGTEWPAPAEAIARGLSPRVRGNQELGKRRGSEQRSIPACAGEPQNGSQYVTFVSVYPRVCGGTRSRGSRRARLPGLSPRVRGNRRRIWLPEPNTGSIPACAGEPSQRGHPARPRGVYPRVCGGTWRSCASTTSLYGLSPRVRGNPRSVLEGWHL